MHPLPVDHHRQHARRGFERRAAEDHQVGIAARGENADIVQTQHLRRRVVLPKRRTHLHTLDIAVEELSDWLGVTPGMTGRALDWLAAA